MMKIRVKLFAALTVIVGERELTWELPDGATIATLMDGLATTYPKLATRQASLHTALNRRYVSRDIPLKDNDEVAIFPPVSGG